MNHEQGAASSVAFRGYLHHCELSLLDVALAAWVRLLMVWKIELQLLLLFNSP